MARPFWVPIVNFLRWILSSIQSWIRRSTGPIITTDTGRRVRLGRQIAQGGFSFVFEATDDNNNSHERYALKRIPCPDPELLQACRQEAAVHRAVRHANLMPLLGMSVVNDKNNNSTTCYMLFPYIPHSLRSEVNRRTFDRRSRLGQDAPWSSEVTVLQLFHQILQGVQALHVTANYSHRDIKVENIQLTSTTHSSQQIIPVLMDFGSAGPTVQPLTHRRDVLTAIEQASIHTTLPYRPPELFEGGLRTGDEDLDYTAVDVWSCGCTLFGMLYGASPFECEFSRSSGMLNVVDCTQLSVLKPVPRPPAHTPAYQWYSQDMHELLMYILEQDRHKRPKLDQVLQRVQELIEKKGGRVKTHRAALSTTHSLDQGDDDDQELLSSVV